MSIRRSSILRFAITASLAAALCSQLAAQSSKDSDAGIKFSTQATAREVGLPLYPGATPHKEAKGDSSAANMGLWGNSFGLKLVVLKLQSKDSTDKVAAFYQKALAKYGKVLNCTPGSKDALASKDADKEKDKSSKNTLTCDSDDGDKDGQVFKSGTKNKQHIVAVQPNGQGSVFQLVYVDTHGIDDDEHAQ